MAYVLDRQVPGYDDPADGSGSNALAAYNGTFSVSFAPTVTADIGKVSLRFKKVGSPTGNINVYIYSDDGTTCPNSSLVTANETLDISTISTDALGAEYDFTFNAGTELTDGTTYHIVIVNSAGVSSSNYILLMWDYNPSPAYTGQIHYGGTGAWDTFDTSDRFYTFKEYYIQAGDYTLDCEAGSLVLTGQDIALTKGYNLLCEVGSLVLTGYDIVLSITGAIWSSLTKNTSSYTNESKNSSSYTNQDKNNSSWSNKSKN